MKEKTAAFEDKADKNHHFLSEVYAATISKEANYKIQVLNTSSIETVKTRGEEIEEVWIRERYGSLTLLYKKRTAG